MGLRSNGVVSLKILSIEELFVQRIGKFGMQVLNHLVEEIDAYIEIGFDLFLNYCCLAEPILASYSSLEP